MTTLVAMLPACIQAGLFKGEEHLAEKLPKVGKSSREIDTSVGVCFQVND